jgi:circadian clock protein KaiC
MHLALLHKLVSDFHPQVVIIDPITTFLTAGNFLDTEAMLMRLIDYLKGKHITAFFTSLTQGGDALEKSHTGISSLIDTWLLLRAIELGGERNRGIYILKSRGMAHSNQIREFLLTDRGVELKNVYIGPEGVLTGSLRLAQESREQAEVLVRDREIERRRRELDRKRRVLEAQITVQRTQFEAEEDEFQLLLGQKLTAEETEHRLRELLSLSRQADGPDPAVNNRPQQANSQGGRP